jgi:chemotaxis protein MotB
MKISKKLNMIQTILYPFVIYSRQILFYALCLLISSCSANKKISADTIQMNSLKSSLDSLSIQNSKLQSELSDCNKDLKKLTTENIQTRKEAEDCRAAKETISQRFNNLNSTLSDQEMIMREIKNKAVNALEGLKVGVSQVTYRNGMIYISMEDDFLFPTGKATVSQSARKSVLPVIASLLAEYPDVSVIVVGNTDSLKISRGYADNWSLSTERANSVVRILRNTYHVDPSRLTAAGKGAYRPIDNNNTPEGRSKNKRFYLIINPDKSGLWLLSQKYP